MVNHIIYVSISNILRTYSNNIKLYFSVELIQTNPQMFNDGQPRRSSDTSMQSTVSGLIDNVPITTITARMFILYTVLTV